MRIQLLILVCLSALPPCLAQTIALRTTVRDVFIQSNSQQPGNITFVISEEVFEGISPENPAYIRLTLDKDAFLCRTLVWTSEANPDPVTQMPIYLPLSFQNSEANNQITLESASAISIVRWKAGENGIWLKVTQPAQSFVTDLLNENNRVSFDLGFSARTYWDQNQLRFLNSEANLPGSTRDPSDPLAVTRADMVSTLLCTDYRQSTLTASPWNPETQTIGNFNVATFDVTTRGVDGPQAVSNQADIVLGEVIAPTFSADNPISKGIRSVCIAQASNEDIVIGEGSLCNSGLINFTSSRAIQISCSNSWGFHERSEGVITLSDDAQYGFRVQVDTQGNPLEDDRGRVLLFAEDFIFGVDNNPPPLAYCSPEDIFLATGDHIFSRRAILVYEGPNTLGGINLTIATTVFQDASAGSATVMATKQLRIGNREPEDVLDAAPFDGLQDQHRRCPPGYREVTLDQEFLLGEFTTCSPGGAP